MLDKLYTYQGNQVQIADYEIDGDKFIIKTSGEDIMVFKDNFSQFLTEIEPVSNVLTVSVKSTPATETVAINLPSGAATNDVNSLLFEMMQKVSKNAALIPQAKAMADLGKTIHAGNRNQIDAAKVLIQSANKRG